MKGSGLCWGCPRLPHHLAIVVEVERHKERLEA